MSSKFTPFQNQNDKKILPCYELLSYLVAQITCTSWPLTNNNGF